jgi:hypothetical protein
MQDANGNYDGGWLDDGGHVAIAATLPRFASLMRQACLAPSPAAPSAPILLYEAWKDVLGKYPDYPAQQIGDCVSFGHAHANDLLQCIEIALGEPSEFRETDTEFIYGESRKVSHNLTMFDGSYGAAAVKAMTQVGVVSREMLGSDGAYSGSRAKSWGWHGPPADVEAKAAPYKLGAVSRIDTWDELYAAISNGLPVTICSNWGFATPRDAQGFCNARGTWAHCMMIAGMRFDREGACVCQSWGPSQPSGPLALDQPSFSFWADRKYIEKILAQGDSWALMKSPDFVHRTVPKNWRLA